MTATDTIAAIATPPGRGGVGIVRVSGPAVPSIATALLGRLPPPRSALLQTFRTAQGDPIDTGLALYFPGFSTTMAAPGLYVQDLWVSGAARGAGLGKRLLAAAATHAAETWGAQYLALTVYEDNPKAQVFYEALGFGLHKSENPARLTGQKFEALKAQV